MIDREHLTDALRFWERGRIWFNLVLAAVTLAIVASTGFLWSIPPDLYLAAASTTLILAALANILYCAAYPVDLVLQASGYRERWRQMRWVLWSAGALLGAAFVYVTLLGVRPPL